MKNTQVLLRCEICGTEFKRKRSHIKKSIFCSKECTDRGKEKAAYQRMCDIVGGEFKGWLNIEYTNNLRPIRDISRELYGSDKCSSSVLNWLAKFGIETRDRSEAVRLQWVDNDERRKATGDGLKKWITDEVRAKVHAGQQTPEYKENQRIKKTGELNGMYGVTGANNPKWNPDRTHEQRAKERKTFEYSSWRRDVLVRDNYKCRLCGDKRGRNLVVHHLDSYQENKDGRYDMDNGITLCKTCHLGYHHEHGWKSATRKKFEQFVASREAQTA